MERTMKYTFLRAAQTGKKVLVYIKEKCIFTSLSYAVFNRYICAIFTRCLHKGCEENQLLPLGVGSNN